MPSARQSLLAAASLAALVLGLLPSLAPAAETIDLSLNVFYTNSSNVNSGGIWSLSAKSTGSGIGGLSVRLTNIASAQNEGPRATVNGSDPAGFSLFTNTSFPLYQQLAIGQVPASLSSGEEQTAFYGVGTLTNGAPNYPGKPVGSNSIGPAFTSLTSPSDIPWAVADPFSNPAWATGAIMASGAFSAGVTPAFFPGSSGNVFTTIGSSTVYGNLDPAMTVNTILRTNFNNVSQFPDYNQNGTVDAADYVLWRRTSGQAVANGTGADGIADGMIDMADYNLWRSKFGNTSGTGSGSGLTANVVPEPSSMCLVVVGLLLVLCLPRPVLARATAGLVLGHRQHVS